MQAALASAGSFVVGGLVPFLGLLAHGSLLRPAARVLLGGALAMAITALVGQIAHVRSV